MYIRWDQEEMVALSLMYMKAYRKQRSNNNNNNNNNNKSETSSFQLADIVINTFTNFIIKYSKYKKLQDYTVIYM